MFLCITIYPGSLKGGWSNDSRVSNQKEKVAILDVEEVEQGEEKEEEEKEAKSCEEYNLQIISHV